MALFFFFSGYFSPRSLDKKGVARFIHERFIRLGLPFTIYTIIISKWLGEAIKNAFLKGGSYHIDWTNGAYDPQTTWFIAQLLVFSVLYALSCGKGWKPTWEYPGVCVLLVIGLGVGFVSSGISLVIPGNQDFMGSRFFVTPHFWVQYLSYVLFYFGGAIAERNRWMEAMAKSGWKPRVATYAVCLALLVLTVFMKWCGSQNDPKIQQPKAEYLFGIFFARTIYAAGLSTVAWSLGVTFFFMDFVNFKTKFTDFFAKSMYTAYILQESFPDALAFQATIAIANALNLYGFTIEFTEEQKTVDVPTGDYTILLWLICSTILFAFIWPLSYGIRSLPVLNKIL